MKSNISLAIETLDQVFDRDGEVYESANRKIRIVGFTAIKGVVEARFTRSVYLGGLFGDDVLAYTMSRSCLEDDSHGLRSIYHFTNNPNNRQFSLNHSSWSDQTSRPEPGIALGRHTDFSYKVNEDEVKRIASGESIEKVLSECSIGRTIWTVAQDFYTSSPEIPAIKTKGQLGKVVLEFLNA